MSGKVSDAMPLQMNNINDPKRSKNKETSTAAKQSASESITHNNNSKEMTEDTTVVYSVDYPDEDEDDNLSASCIATLCAGRK